MIDDFLSGDSYRVWSATWETIRSRDSEQLDAVLAALPEIRRATADLDLGGGIIPNRDSLKHAFAKLANYRKGACWCANYPHNLRYDPEKEQRAGHVRILEASEPPWSRTFRCACSVCGTVFAIQEGEHHATWWSWKRSRTPATAEGRPPAGERPS